MIGDEIDEDQWSLWGRIVNDWDDYKRKKEKLKVTSDFYRDLCHPRYDRRNVEVSIH